VVAVAIGAAAVVAACGSGRTTPVKRYPYTLVEPGTLGGPSSFLVEPSACSAVVGSCDVALTSQGSVLGAADTAIRDLDYRHCPPPSPGGCSDRYVQHPFAWREGKLTDLGALAGQNSAFVDEQNSSGLGVGGSEDGRIDPFTKRAASVAVLFERGKVIKLGALPGGYESSAQNIDDQGQVAGFSSNAIRDRYACGLFGQTPPCGWTTQVRAVVWRHGVISDLGTLGGPDALDAAENEEGEVAGESYTNDHVNDDTSVPPQAPFLWKNGHMINLGTLGGHSGEANWLNDRGEVVGQSNLPGDGSYNAFLWNGRRMIDLTPRAAKSAANWINDQGDVAGWTCVSMSSVCTGFLWRDGKLSVLPIVPPDVAWADPNCVNDRDQVVGAESNASNTRFVVAALWADGRAYNLNKLVAPSSLRMISANYVNNQGDIVGYGTLPNGDQRVFLLTRNPTVPLPSS
jgi:probable HAF family extracellular repeat protein